MLLNLYKIMYRSRWAFPLAMIATTGAALEAGRPWFVIPYYAALGGFGWWAMMVHLAKFTFSDITLPTKK